MKTKYLHIVVILSAALLSLQSCAGFLEEKSTTSLSESSVYSSEEALESQVYGVLSAFYGNYMMQGYMNEMLHTASGLIMWKGQRTQDDWADGLKLGKYSISNPTQQMYAQLYSAIACCNRLLENLPSSPVGDSFKNEIQGETRFYRAVLYYYLVRLYGDVPLLLKCAGNFDETNNPRTAYYKVYDAIVKDLEFAEQNMRDKARAEAVAPGKGRPCKWAATAMKASVYMTIGSLLSSFEADPNDQFFDVTKDAALIAAGKDPRTPDFKSLGIQSAKDAWSLCYAASESVINSGTYSLCPDYRQLFRWTKPEDFTLSERIFVLQSTNTSAPENRLALMSLPQYVAGSANAEIKNGNAGRWRPSRFLFHNFAKDNGGSLGTAQATQNVYVSCPDPRFNASFFHTSIPRINRGNLKVYPYKDYIEETNSTYCLPYFKKYLDPTFDVNSGCADFYLMRYAEMYLISAEAAANLSTAAGDGMWKTALDRIETLHVRARQSTDGAAAAYPSWKERTFADRQALLDAIFWERAYEMCGEGHEFFDTHRFGAKWLSRVISLPHNEFMKRVENKLLFDYSYIGTEYPTGQAELRKSLLCAFPALTEGSYNTAIDKEKDQNDFYWK